MDRINQKGILYLVNVLLREDNSGENEVQQPTRKMHDVSILLIV